MCELFQCGGHDGQGSERGAGQCTLVLGEVSMSGVLIGGQHEAIDLLRYAV